MLTIFGQFLFDVTFATLLCVSIPLIGISVFSVFSRKVNASGLEIFAYGSAVGVVVYAIIGLIIGNLESYQQVFVIIFLFFINALALYHWRKTNLLYQLRDDFASIIKITWISWLLMSILSIAISHLTIKFPDELFDGPYVIKNHNLHVKIQTITGHFPADNFLPHLVSEFFLRDISFTEERPLMPGQEISNRPILMALVAIPFRAAIDPPPKQVGTLPKFEYVGTLWPDIGTLGEDRYFRLSLVIGIVLNAMIVIGSILIFRSMGLNRKYILAGVLLLIFGPYFISQIIFTWPKALAAFYLLLAMHALTLRGWSIFSGILTALAYLSHPYALVFAGSFGLYLLLKSIKDGDRGRVLFLSPAAKFSIAFVLVVLPWFIWTKVILKISSDLIAQNFLSDGYFSDQIWIRLHNFYETMFPRFFEITPFNADQILQQSLVCLPGVIGILFILQAYLASIKYFNEHRFFILYGIFVPGLLLIVVFSAPAVPAIHGFQAIAPLLIALSLKWMQHNASFGVLVKITLIQLLINLALLGARAETLGVFSSQEQIKNANYSSLHSVLPEDGGSLSLLTWSSIGILNAATVPQVNIPVSVLDIEKLSIWMNPPTSMVFSNIEIGPSSSFHSFVAIHPAVWGESGADGVIYRVAVVLDGVEEVIMEKVVNPFEIDYQKNWNEINLDLKQYENKKIDIVLSVDSGAKGNDYADWSIWGSPRVITNSESDK